MEKAKEILEACPEEPVKEVVKGVIPMHIILQSCLKALWDFSHIIRKRVFLTGLHK